MRAWSSGQSIAGRYRLEEPLGSGGSAQAWSANDAVTRARVLVKLPRALSGTGVVRTAEAAFRREYDVSRALDHSDVPRALAQGSDGDCPFLVTTCVEGGNLAARRGQTFGRLAPLLLNLARTLAYVHERGWVHRDVKSSNVLVSGEHRALLTDFGIAARIGEQQPPDGGSPFTRSPQQAAGLPAAVSDDLYSFGALLHELLSGNPPHYPDRAAVNIDARRPPRLESVGAVPVRIERLIERLLDPEPAARPASMREVIAELEVVMNETKPLGAPEAEAADKPASEVAVTPRWRAPTASPVQGASGGRSRWWPWAAAAAFLAAVFVVFVVLPRHAPKPAPVAVSEVPTAVAPPAGALNAASAAAREAALRAQSRYIERAAALEKRHAVAWSGPELAQASAAAAEGDQHLKSEEFPEGLVAYTQAGDHLTTVEAAAPAALAKALQDGATALAAARVAEATQAFNLALAIDPANAIAQHGLKRAAAADSVQALLIDGQRAADASDWSQAAAAYRHALALDGESLEARNGLAAAERLAAEAQYQTSMAAALKALNLRRFAEARANIERARAVRPNAAEPKDLAARVDGAIAGTRIGDLRVEATEHERNERWNDALTVYESILSRNATLMFAREGRERVVPRVNLDARLTDFAARPERLGYPEVREAARRALVQAHQIANAGPVLRAETQKVEALLNTAEKPVRVALESDAATQVVIYRVGALGTFTRREVELPPGTYTVLGTRTGFRDVRQELRVRPGQAPAALVVRCEDPI